MITLLLLPYLLINRADSNLAMNNGFTPLMIASLIGHDDVIQLTITRKKHSNKHPEQGGIHSIMPARMVNYYWSFLPYLTMGQIL